MKAIRLLLLFLAVAGTACVSRLPREEPYALSVETGGKLVYGPKAFDLPETKFTVDGAACQNDRSIPLSFFVRAEEMEPGHLYYHCVSNCYRLFTGELSSVRLSPGATDPLACAGGDSARLLMTRRSAAGR